MNPDLTIGIIGGGFSGVSVAVQLARQTKKKIHIILFNTLYPFAEGVAYSTRHPMHVLNVTAGRMSFFPDSPNHFAEWILKKHTTEFSGFGLAQLEDAFVPRSLYANYISDVFTHEIIFNPLINFTLIEETASSISEKENNFIVSTDKKNNFSCDKIILATGNESPAVPSFISDEIVKKEIYCENPWQTQSQKTNNSSESILLLGTGLTMIDNMLSIFNQGFKGKIIAVSTKGFLPLAFRKSETDYAILNELKKPYDINTVFDIFRKHVHRVRNYGVSGVSIVDALRPLTQEIWKELSFEDRKRFLVHIRRLWGVARHRLPFTVFDLMNSYINSKRLEIFAGRLTNVKLQNGIAKATIKLRATSEKLHFNIQKIINCTGPLTDITKSKSPLIKNLIAAKIITPDALHLGINATADGNIINERGNVSNSMYTLGPPLKGVLWESTAVPEIRVQAMELAKKILA